MKRLYIRKVTIVFIITVFTMSVLPAATHAAVKRYWPDKFKPYWTYIGFTNRFHLQVPDRATFAAGAPTPFENWQGWVEVKLPVGKKITRVTLVHKNPSGTYARLSLYRVKFGKEAELLAFGESNQWSLDPREEVIPFEDGAEQMVMKGYRYYLLADCEANSSLRGVKIRYK
jgi:hypothetical protein